MVVRLKGLGAERLGGAELAQIVRAAEPNLPPAEVIVPVSDEQTRFNFRVRVSTMAALEAEAQRQGVPVKLLLMRAAQKVGVTISSLDLRDGSNKARRKR